MLKYINSGHNNLSSDSTFELLGYLVNNYLNTTIKTSIQEKLNNNLDFTFEYYTFFYCDSDKVRINECINVSFKDYSSKDDINNMIDIYKKEFYSLFMKSKFLLPEKWNIL